MLLKIVRKELREVVRDSFLCVVLGVFLAVLIFSCVTSRNTWAGRSADLVDLQHQAREDWLTQPSLGPHQATHRGTTVYKLPAPLVSLDPGVEAELGTAIRLESHHRHPAEQVANTGRLNLLQLNWTTPALLLQAVLPLVVIWFSHARVSRERELGTWGLLMNLGVSARQIVMGKLTATLFVLVLLGTPIWLSLAGIVMSDTARAEMPWAEVFWRAVGFSIANLLYLAGWCAAGTALSARFSSGTSLIILVSVWAGWTLVLPRLAADLAYSRYPLPSQHSLLAERKEAIRQGTNGRISLEELNRALEQRLLRQYGAQDLEDLPIDLNAARLLAMEDYTNSLDDEMQARLDEIYQQQNRLHDWFGKLSPYMAIRSVSASFAGSDRSHHHMFAEAAETQRRLLVETMNTAEMQGEGPGATAESARQFWGRVPEFQQARPGMATVVSSQREPLGLLMAWFLSMFTFAMLPSKRLTA